jgi:hypothetical protein
MKDDLTNKITGSVTTEGGFPLVVKVTEIFVFESAFNSY